MEGLVSDCARVVLLCWQLLIELEHSVEQLPLHCKRQISVTYKIGFHIVMRVQFYDFVPTAIISQIALVLHFIRFCVVHLAQYEAKNDNCDSKNYVVNSLINSNFCGGDNCRHR